MLIYDLDLSLLPPHHPPLPQPPLSLPSYQVKICQLYFMHGKNIYLLPTIYMTVDHHNQPHHLCCFPRTCNKRSTWPWLGCLSYDVSSLLKASKTRTWNSPGRPPRIVTMPRRAVGGLPALSQVCQIFANNCSSRRDIVCQKSCN